jgi:ubiquinone biosynthesis protein
MGTAIRDLRRWWQVQSIFLSYGFEMLIARSNLREVKQQTKALGTQPPPAIDQMGTPRRLRLMIEALGPTYIKLGQVVSSQTQAIPREWLTELEKLQDTVPPFPGEQVREQFLLELKAPPEQLFKSFDLNPLAAASIGQVHTAVLLDDQHVAVKVQRPNIIPQVEADLSIMREAARVLESTTSWGKNYGVSSIVEEFATSLFKELDYRNEGRNADTLRQNLSGIKGMRTPCIHWDLVTDKILTMERIEGIKITKVDALREAKVDLNKAADVFIRGMVQQVLIDGFFHADVHPGNVFIDPKNGEIVLIDLGMTGFLDERQRVELGNLMRALSKLDGHRVTQVILALGEPYKPIDRAALERDIDQLLRHHLSGALSQFSYARFVSELLATIFEYGVRVPSDLIFALKAIMQTEQIARTLNPNIKITDIAQTASRQLITYQFKPSNIRTSLGNAVEQALMIAPLFGDAVEQYLRDVKSGRPALRLDTSDLNGEIREARKVANRMSLALLLVGTMIASILGVSVGRQYDLQVIYLIGTVGFVITLSLSVWLTVVLIWRIWR